MAATEKQFQRAKRTYLMELASRFSRVRAGLDLGFGDAGVSQSFRLAAGGAWMTVEPDDFRREAVAAALGTGSVLKCGMRGELPFEDRQFDLVLVAPGVADVSNAEVLVREYHRVLMGGGHLMIALPSRTRETPDGFDGRRLYEIMKKGFDLLAVHRAPWWRFGSQGTDLLVVARRKNWRAKDLRIVTDATPVSDAMLYSRT